MVTNHSQYLTIKNISVKPNSGLEFVLSQHKPIIIPPVALPTDTLVSLRKLVTSGYIRI